ncbi:MAG TPA: hypothetical protein VL068_07660, partial [Microthrixaceae bacterium]|nr:hypothetical protein [Microthrixaceae bacterium]
VSILAGIGGGMALAIHAQDPFSLRASLPILAAALTCFISALMTTSEPNPDGEQGWVQNHENAEAARLERLTDLLATTTPSSERVNLNSD